MVLPWFKDPETERRLGGFYPVREQLQKLIADPAKHAWLLWQEDILVGLIELEKEQDIAHVLILVAPGCRGKGFGHKLVAELPPLAKNISTQVIRAYIATDAAASQSCFNTAGYVEVAEEDGFVCYDLAI